mgnify:CR=1 FL=1
MNIEETTLLFKLGNKNNFEDLNVNSDIKHFIADARGISQEVGESIKNNFINLYIFS